MHLDSTFTVILMHALSVFVAIAFCAMVGYPAFVIYLEMQEKKNDDWKDNYLPEYPRVRWHLDEEMLEVCSRFPFKRRHFHVHLHGQACYMRSVLLHRVRSLSCTSFRLLFFRRLTYVKSFSLLIKVFQFLQYLS